MRIRTRLLLRWREWELRRRPGRSRLTGTHWAVLAGFAATAVFVASALGPPEPPSPVDPGLVSTARQRLSVVPVLPSRPAHRSDYRREAFGPAWTDDAGIGGSGNGCDTRNDVLARDLQVTARTPTSSCPTAVAAGRLRSPYTGADLVFRRGRGSAAVQIDHVVPLSYAWDMGAWSWTAATRTALANDPANLLAVDAASNQAKSDAEPARWMPALRGFRCPYAVQFVAVLSAYRLPVDEPSRRVLASALERC
ncbi:HNH endonuclease family protein [Gordonia sp. VNK21]|uniref:HNH endonuclease family protein n=1 Tax=Gordonia sp. VNK21 TaxID=3382483 RepID=UPI0038D43FEE